jgi:hypothetical protein
VNQSNTSGATSGVGHPSKASKSSFQNIKEFLLKHQRVPSKSPEFLPNHQRVPSKASKSSFQSIKEFLPKHQRVPSKSSKSSFHITTLIYKNVVLYHRCRYEDNTNLIAKS